MCKNCYTASVKKSLSHPLAWLALWLAGALHAQVVINEVQYNPSGSIDETEFIEFWNIGVTTISLAGWYLQDGVDYVFPAGARIQPGGFLVLVNGLAAFTRAYSLVTKSHGCE